jgi:hypothetical protein
MKSLWIGIFDPRPVKGKYTWSNRMLGPGYIAECLYHFFLQSSYLLDNMHITSSILPSVVSDHKLILLNLQADLNCGPTPFRFNPLWLQGPRSLTVII